MRQDHESRQKCRPKLGNDNPPIKVPVGRTVHLRRFENLIVDPAQTSEKHRHNETAGLPDSSHYYRINCVVPVLDPVKAEAFPPPTLNDVLQPDAGVQKPFPRRPGYDEAQRHWVEIQRAQSAFAANFLIEEDS